MAKAPDQSRSGAAAAHAHLDINIAPAARPGRGDGWPTRLIPKVALSSPNTCAGWRIAAVGGFARCDCPKVAASAAPNTGDVGCPRPARCQAEREHCQCDEMLEFHGRSFL